MSFISDDFVEHDAAAASKDVVREVASWKLEAKAEDNDRYFFHVREVSSIENGDKCFVIGRKGSGKTAICEYLGRAREARTYAEKLTFKNFPFNELYALQNEGYTRPNQYISLWKYLIYTNICRLMVGNDAIDQDVRSKLRTIFSDDRRTPLNRKISRWIAKDFSLSVFGFSISLSGGSPPPAEKETWIDRVNVLEDIVIQYIDTSKYFIIFDELDEDYRDIINNTQRAQYTSLITGLFKAVQDIKTIFRDKSRYSIFPVIFLRDDIYEIIQDSDKNKWSDFRLDLIWDIDRIKRLISFRITCALDSKATTILDFDDAWGRLMGKQTIGVGSGRGRAISSFEYIARSTYLRPRDFVKYLQACAQDAVDDDCLIRSDIIRKVDKAFSNYLKDELVDELFAILPDISTIFDVISQIRKWNFSVDEFQDAFLEQQDRGGLKERDTGFVLQVLFIFSVIGNLPHTGRYIFRYANREVRFNFRDRIIVHRGLFKALQIV